MNHTVATAHQDETLSHLLWRHYGRRLPGMVEQVLPLNPHLSRCPPALAAGTVVHLPPAPPRQPSIQPMRQLWD